MVVKGDHGAWFFGDKGVCARVDSRPMRPFRLIILGPPGVGKRTLATRITDHYRGCPLATSEVFRGAKISDPALHTPSLAEALVLMQTGQHLPDEIINKVIQERSHCIACGYGFVLTDFPRSLEQAAALDKILADHRLALDGVLHCRLSKEQSLRRITGRRWCTSCASEFHVEFHPPRTPDVCNYCGSALWQHESDTEAVVETRLKKHHKNCAPLLEYYGGRGFLHTIDADGTPLEVFARAQETLQAIAPEFTARLA